MDDIIVDKGSGVIILLHGPSGVGKTLTAEAIAEHLKLPLYSISAGQLSLEASLLETQLNQIFDVATSWKAVLLLDEADVYLQRRDSLNLQRNQLVAVFLRTLEYYRGIFFLTTNMSHYFDAAILDRIQLKLRYDDLRPSDRKTIFNHFLKRANVEITDEDLIELAGTEINGRQIKNVIKIAWATTTGKISAKHIRMALRANGFKIPSLNSPKIDNSLYQSD
ncbi:hypothetical protein N7486_002579 [Penicillium sp. IBT 16267x]|nr:hypothetical protein N7486_002579 [Penicillium sp. IBT 16267x]